MNNFELAEWIDKEYRIENFMEWIAVWLECVEWDFPAMLNEIPNNLMSPFVIDGVYYRGMIIGSEDKAINVDACSWTTDINEAMIFTEQEGYINNILDEGCIPYGVVYEAKGSAISLMNIIDYILNYLSLAGKDDYENINTLINVFDRFKPEKEYIMKFDTKVATEVFKFKC